MSDFCSVQYNQINQIKKKDIKIGLSNEWARHKQKSVRKATGTIYRSH